MGTVFSEIKNILVGPTQHNVIVVYFDVDRTPFMDALRSVSHPPVVGFAFETLIHHELHITALYSSERHPKMQPLIDPFFEHASLVVVLLDANLTEANIEPIKNNVQRLLNSPHVKETPFLFVANETGASCNPKCCEMIKEALDLESISSRPWSIIAFPQTPITDVIKVIREGIGTSLQVPLLP